MELNTGDLDPHRLAAVSSAHVQLHDGCARVLCYSRMPLRLHPRNTSELRSCGDSMVDLRGSFQCRWGDSSANRVAWRAAAGASYRMGYPEAAEGFGCGCSAVDRLGVIHPWLHALVQKTTVLSQRTTLCRHSLSVPYLSGLSALFVTNSDSLFSSLSNSTAMGACPGWCHRYRCGCDWSAMLRDMARRISQRLSVPARSFL